MNAPWSIDYHDGSANAFHARDAGDGATFEYVPVRPEQSSTGLYSGGEPKRGALTPAAVASLWAQIATLEGSLRTTERGKGTGAFSLRDATGTRDFIVQRSPALAAFDELIARL